jgi:hypothetical protein
VFRIHSAALFQIDGMTKALFCGLALLVSAAAAVAQPRPAGSLTDVTGVWIMLIEGHQVGLELEQDGQAVKGVMLMMGQRILLTGTYANRDLSLVREKTEDEPVNPHGQAAKSGGPITARMLDDGTLEGELTTNRGRTTWTGERLQQP